ncbi:phosphatidylinositol N-acetylglucosaminyltransferase subunit C [Mycena rebaudengoi]|nr:phosphatidylinositol N-acetylglucosaminyltransferase subunit C [Mycena rebaudengoi]
MISILLDRSGADNAHRHVNRAKAAKSSILIFLALLSLSPVLRTLTAATSSDSIWALSAALFILNALLADYSAMSPRRQVNERLTSVLSMNAAISASVVLASRVANDLAVFALILFSVQAFALFPQLRHRLGLCPAAVQLAFTVFLSAVSIIITVPLSRTVSWIYWSVQLGVTILAPSVLTRCAERPSEIRRPWDVAVPKVNY